MKSYASKFQTIHFSDPFTKWSAGEPNDKVCANKSKPAGCEQCIRMRNGGGMTDMNDAICGNTWVGPAHEMDPMSFICQSDFPTADYDDSPLCPSAYRGQSQPDSGCYVQNLQWDGSGQQNIQCDMLNPLCLDVTCSPTGMTAKLRADLFHTHQLNLDTIQQQLIAGGTAVGGTGRDLLVNGIRVPHQSQTQNTDLYFTVTNEFVVVNWSYQSTQVAAVASLDHLDSCAGEGDNAIGYTISFTAPGNSAENNQDIEFYVDTTVHATCQYCTNFDIEAENFWVNQEDVNAIQQDYGSLAPLFDCKLFSDSNRQPGSEVKEMKVNQMLSFKLTDDNIVNMGETIYGEVTSSENLPNVKYRLVEFKVTDGTNPQNSYNVVDANVAQTDVSASKDPDADTGSSLFFQYMSFGFQGNANQNVLINQCKIELYLDNGNGK